MRKLPTKEIAELLESLRDERNFLKARDCDDIPALYEAVAVLLLQQVPEEEYAQDNNEGR